MMTSALRTPAAQAHNHNSGPVCVQFPCLTQEALSGRFPRHRGCPWMTGAQFHTKKAIQGGPWGEKGLPRNQVTPSPVHKLPTRTGAPDALGEAVQTAADHLSSNASEAHRRSSRPEPARQVTLPNSSFPGPSFRIYLQALLLQVVSGGSCRMW